MFTEAQNIKYAAETSTVVFQGKPIKLTNFTPVLSPEQREKRKREIERTLFGIFRKYAATN
jgi:hypothetical protein